MYKYYNPSPIKANVGDCVIRALSKALDKEWEEAYIDVCLQGLIMFDMPSSNHIWGSYLREHGFERHLISDDRLGDYTLENFCDDHSEGVYVVALPNHVVTVVDGDYYDLWDSGEERPLYYWKRR